MTARSSGLLALIVLLLPSTILTAPLIEQSTETESYYPVSDATGCYYNFHHYDEGDRIITNEMCLNCTCHNRMLMCYLRVCPYIKAIGENCKVEKRSDQCCPVITCPEVPVTLLTSTTETSASSEVGHLDKYGCSIDRLFYSDGARVPSDPNKPCELCYCIRNKTACVMQECTLHIEGCKPVYQEGVCCPVKYDCDHPEEALLDTTVGPTPTAGLIFTTTLPPGVSSDCIHDGEIYADGGLIRKETACEHCYCMKGDIVCAVQECGPTPLDKINCTALPSEEGKCCPDTYDCEYVSEQELTTTYYELTTQAAIKHEEENVISEYTTSEPLLTKDEEISKGECEKETESYAPLRPTELSIDQEETSKVEIPVTELHTEFIPREEVKKGQTTLSTPEYSEQTEEAILPQSITEVVDITQSSEKSVENITTPTIASAEEITSTEEIVPKEEVTFGIVRHEEVETTRPIPGETASITPSEGVTEYISTEEIEPVTDSVTTIPEEEKEVPAITETVPSISIEDLNKNILEQHIEPVQIKPTEQAEIDETTGQYFKETTDIEEEIGITTEGLQEKSPTGQTVTSSATTTPLEHLEETTVLQEQITSEKEIVPEKPLIIESVPTLKPIDSEQHATEPASKSTEQETETDVRLEEELTTPTSQATTTGVISEDHAIRSETVIPHSTEKVSLATERIPEEALTPITQKEGEVGEATAAPALPEIKPEIIEYTTSAEIDKIQTEEITEREIIPAVEIDLPEHEHLPEGVEHIPVEEYPEESETTEEPTEELVPQTEVQTESITTKPQETPEEATNLKHKAEIIGTEIPEEQGISSHKPTVEKQTETSTEEEYASASSSQKPTVEEETETSSEEEYRPEEPVTSAPESAITESEVTEVLQIVSSTEATKTETVTKEISEPETETEKSVAPEHLPEEKSTEEPTKQSTASSLEETYATPHETSKLEAESASTAPKTTSEESSTVEVAEPESTAPETIPKEHISVTEISEPVTASEVAEHSTSKYVTQVAESESTKLVTTETYLEEKTGKPIEVTEAIKAETSKPITEVTETEEHEKIKPEIQTSSVVPEVTFPEQLTQKPTISVETTEVPKEIVETESNRPSEVTSETSEITKSSPTTEIIEPVQTERSTEQVEIVTEISDHTVKGMISLDHVTESEPRIPSLTSEIEQETIKPCDEISGCVSPQEIPIIHKDVCGPDFPCEVPAVPEVLCAGDQLHDGCRPVEENEISQECINGDCVKPAPEHTEKPLVEEKPSIVEEKHAAQEKPSEEGIPAEEITSIKPTEAVAVEETGKGELPHEIKIEKATESSHYSTEPAIYEEITQTEKILDVTEQEKQHVQIETEKATEASVYSTEHEPVTSGYVTQTAEEKLPEEIEVETEESGKPSEYSTEEAPVTSEYDTQTQPGQILEHTLKQEPEKSVETVKPSQYSTESGTLEYNTKTEPSETVEEHTKTETPEEFKIVEPTEQAHPDEYPEEISKTSAPELLEHVTQQETVTVPDESSKRTTETSATERSEAAITETIKSETYAAEEEQQVTEYPSLQTIKPKETGISEHELGVTTSEELSTVSHRLPVEETTAESETEIIQEFEGEATEKITEPELPEIELTTQLGEKETAEEGSTTPKYLTEEIGTEITKPSEHSQLTPEATEAKKPTEVTETEPAHATEGATKESETITPIESTEPSKIPEHIHPEEQTIKSIESITTPKAQETEQTESLVTTESLAVLEEGELAVTEQELTPLPETGEGYVPEQVTLKTSKPLDVTELPSEYLEHLPEKKNETYASKSPAIEETTETATEEQVISKTSKPLDVTELPVEYPEHLPEREHVISTSKSPVVAESTETATEERLPTEEITTGSEHLLEVTESEEPIETLTERTQDHTQITETAVPEHEIVTDKAAEIHENEIAEVAHTATELITSSELPPAQEITTSAATEVPESEQITQFQTTDCEGENCVKELSSSTESVGVTSGLVPSEICKEETGCKPSVVTESVKLPSEHLVTPTQVQPGVQECIDHECKYPTENIIPGEGSCLVDGHTYANNSSVPPINRCQLSCKCISSILICDSVTCLPAPSNLENCMPLYRSQDSCCPTYSCTSPGPSTIKSDSHKMDEETTKPSTEFTTFRESEKPAVIDQEVEEHTIEPQEQVTKHIPPQEEIPVIVHEPVPSATSTEGAVSELPKVTQPQEETTKLGGQPEVLQEGELKPTEATEPAKETVAVETSVTTEKGVEHEITIPTNLPTEAAITALIDHTTESIEHPEHITEGVKIHEIPPSTEEVSDLSPHSETTLPEIETPSGEIEKATDKVALTEGEAVTILEHVTEKGIQLPPEPETSVTEKLQTEITTVETEQTTDKITETESGHVITEEQEPETVSILTESAKTPEIETTISSKFETVTEIHITESVEIAETPSVTHKVSEALPTEEETTESLKSGTEIPPKVEDNATEKSVTESVEISETTATFEEVPEIVSTKYQTTTPLETETEQQTDNAKIHVTESSESAPQQTENVKIPETEEVPEKPESETTVPQQITEGVKTIEVATIIPKVPILEGVEEGTVEIKTDTLPVTTAEYDIEKVEPTESETESVKLPEVITEKVSDIVKVESETYVPTTTESETAFVTVPEHDTEIVALQHVTETVKSTEVPSDIQRVHTEYGPTVPSEIGTESVPVVTTEYTEHVTEGDVVPPADTEKVVEHETTVSSKLETDSITTTEYATHVSEGIKIPGIPSATILPYIGDESTVLEAEGETEAIQQVTEIPEQLLPEHEPVVPTKSELDEEIVVAATTDIVPEETEQPVYATEGDHISVVPSKKVPEEVYVESSTVPEQLSETPERQHYTEGPKVSIAAGTEKEAIVEPATEISSLPEQETEGIFEGPSVTENEVSTESDVEISTEREIEISKHSEKPPLPITTATEAGPAVELTTVRMADIEHSTAADVTIVEVPSETGKAPEQLVPDHETKAPIEQETETTSTELPETVDTAQTGLPQISEEAPEITSETSTSHETEHIPHTEVPTHAQEHITEGKAEGSHIKTETDTQTTEAEEITEAVVTEGLPVKPVEPEQATEISVTEPAESLTKESESKPVHTASTERVLTTEQTQYQVPELDQGITIPEETPGENTEEILKSHEPSATTVTPEHVTEAKLPSEASTKQVITEKPGLYTSPPHPVKTTYRPGIPGELSTSAVVPSELQPLLTTLAPDYHVTSTTFAPDYHVTEPTKHPLVPEPEEEYHHGDQEYDDEEPGAFGPGTCRYSGKVYVSAQQIPRDDPCDFCFCFRSDIICLQQSCPPPIPKCHEEPIRGFCCPRYECPVSMATSVNISTTTTTTTTTLPPHFLHHVYKGTAKRSGCQIQGVAYSVGEVIKNASGPCLHCVCGGNGQMQCDPKVCSPEPMLRQMIEAAVSRRR